MPTVTQQHKIRLTYCFMDNEFSKAIAHRKNAARFIRVCAQPKCTKLPVNNLHTSPSATLNRSRLKAGKLIELNTAKIAIKLITRRLMEELAGNLNNLIIGVR